MMRSVVRALGAAAVACGLALGGAAAASACDCPAYRKVVCYQTVVCTEVRQVPYLRPVVCYDDCGRPYTAYRECVKEVVVTVTRKVPVVKYVPACD
jgi:hypothetical protein